MSLVENQQLKAFLEDSGRIDKKALEAAFKKAEKTKKPLGQMLTAEGLLSEVDRKKMEAYILGIPFVDLTEETIDPEVLRIIPEPVARSNNIIAFRKKGSDLEVAMLDPQDLSTIDFIRKKASLKIRPRLTTEESIKQALRQYSKSLEAEFGDIIKEEVTGIRSLAAPSEGQQGKEDVQELQKAAEDLPVIRIVDTLLKHAILQRASDVHIEPLEKEVVVRYRIDGVLHDAMVLPKQAATGIVARIKVLSSLKLDEHRLPQDGRFKIETEGYKYSVRVSVLPVFNGEKVVLRLLSENVEGLSLEDLGLWGEAREHVGDAIRRPIGLILITGPTGSGKTTTLYSMVEILNTPEVNISTVEDPIEYRMPRVNQTQVNAKIGLTFASGLRSLLRQDPDILMVGEIRDGETAALAVNAALTGHLVLSTLHTMDAARAVPRLVDMGVEPFLISSTVNAVIAQRLVRRLYDDKEKYTLSPKELKQFSKYCDIDRLEALFVQQGLMKSGQTLTDIPFYRPKETKESPDGYQGRIGIYEVLPANETVKKLIEENATADRIHAQARQEGMVTMVEDGFVKAAQGITSLEEVIRVIME